MIDFRDFVPKLLDPGGLFTAATYESMNESLKAANDWIASENIDVINIETVVLPNIHESDEEGSEDVDLYTSGKSSCTWHQFIRVWYRKEG